MNALQNEITALAGKAGVSDIHFHVGLPLAFRQDGKLEVGTQQPCSLETLEQFLSLHLSPAIKKRWQEERSLDTSCELGAFRFRANYYFESGNPAFVLRKINAVVPDVKQLGLPSVALRSMLFSAGLIVVTGPTACGKSTTLVSLLEYLLTQRAIHLLTIEDPIEHQFRSRRSIISQREVGTDTRDFASALRVALREDPDAILVGEIRDPETARLALTAAETGHLVLTTLHAGTCAAALSRYAGLFPDTVRPEVLGRIADSLVLLLNQKLLPRKNGKGRVAAFEFLYANQAVRTLIREDRLYQLPNLMQTSGTEEMTSMEKAVGKLLKCGEIAAEEAVRC